MAQSRYDAVVTDMESARVGLEHSLTMREVLEQENEKLRSENEKVARDLEVMGSEIQRIIESRQHKQTLLNMHDAELSKVSQARARKLQKLQREYRKLQSRNRELRETVRRYKNALKEARETPPVKLQSHHGASSAESMKEKPVTPESSPVMTLLNGTMKLLNLNTASVNDFVGLLGLREPMAEEVIANRPYRLRGELLAKHVIPNETFAVIKDRITAVPH